MKKLILLFSVFALVLTSCSKDDDSQDPFIASWQTYKYFEDGIETSLDDCEGENTIKVSSNGTIVFNIYIEDMDGNCELEYTFSGTWENLDEGMYSTTIDGQTSTIELNFSGNTMYYEDVDDGVTYREVYIKQ